MQSPRIEYLSSAGFGQKEGEFRYIAVAMNGEAVYFWVHESDWRKFEHSGELEKFLTHQALSVQEQSAELLASGA